VYKCFVIAPYTKFKQNVEEVSKAFPFFIQTEIGNITDGPALAKKAIEEGFDVIVSRGGTARSIQKHCAIPVVEIKITSQDILNTLILLKEHHGKVGIIGSNNVVNGVRMVADLLDMEILEFIIQSEKEIDLAFHQAKRLGVNTIIGDALTVKKASKIGLETVLIPSGKEAIFEALKEVEKMIRFHDRKRKQDRTDDMVTHMTFDQLIVRCTQMRKIISSARKVSGASSPLVIYGEAGTGKQSLAQAIHNESRRDGEFIVLDCEKYLSTQNLEMFLLGTNNKQSLFELAIFGTLYLKNINYLPRKIQTLILDLMNKKMSFNVRLIVSSIEPLDQYVERGDFSKSFYDYLDIYRFHLPPLRQRREDIRDLAKWFLAQSSLKLGKRMHGINEHVLNILEELRWPGNIPQLKTLIEHMCFISNGPFIHEDEVDHLLHLSYQSNKTDGSKLTLTTMNKTLEEIEMEIIYHVLKEEDYNQTWTSKRLGIDRSTLWRKLKAFQKYKRS
jgi:DNA-binding NtrC family response regulator